MKMKDALRFLNLLPKEEQESFIEAIGEKETDIKAPTKEEKTEEPKTEEKTEEPKTEEKTEVEALKEQIESLKALLTSKKEEPKAQEQEETLEQIINKGEL